MKPVRGLEMQAKKAFSLVLFFLFFRTGLSFDDRNRSPVGQTSYGLGEIYVFIFLDELEDASSPTAAEAIIALFGRVYVK